MSFVEFHQKKLLEAIESLDLLLVKSLLSRPHDFGPGWDYRDQMGRSVYSRAINIGLTQMVSTFIEHGIPLGDALLRAADLGMVDIVRVICSHATMLNKRDRKRIIECRCENDDYHPVTTPLMAAAHRNNFTIVKLLLDAGAVLKEPMTNEGQADLTGRAILLMRYRAIASEAYLVHAYSDPLDSTFSLSRRLRQLAARWEDASDEVLNIVREVERFAADYVGHAINSFEVRSILKFTKNESKHPVAKIRAAMEANQRPFVIHPFTQNVLSDSYYDAMLGKSILLHLFFALFAILCHPIISLAYLIYPDEKLCRFLKIPYIKLYMNMGSDLTLMLCVITLAIYDHTTYYVIRLSLEIIIFVYCVGISGKHVQFLYRRGSEKFCSNPLSILDSIMVTICYTTLYMLWLDRLIDRYDQRAMERHVNPLQEVHPNMATQINNTDMPDPVGNSGSTPTWLFADWNEPHVISNTLYSIVVLVCVVRTFYVLSVNQLGIFVVTKSVIGMASDVARVGILFICVILGFGVGITHASNHRLMTARAECQSQGLLPDECPNPPFHSVTKSLLNMYWVLYNLFKKPASGTSLNVDDPYTLYLPAFILMIYSIIATIVLLNLLIAVMTSRYSAVECNADREWKFSRSFLWMSFISDEIILPPPFNILPTMKKLRDILQSICHRKQLQQRTQTKKKVALISAFKEYKQFQSINNMIRDRFIKSRQDSLQQRSELGGKRLLHLGRADIHTFRNEWVELRQQISIAERDLQSMLEMMTSLTKELKEKINIVDHIEERHHSSCSDIDDVHASLLVIENSLEDVDGLVNTLRSLPPEVHKKRPMFEPKAEEKKEEEEKTEEEIKIEIKKEIVKAMAKLYELGKRPHDDQEFMTKLNEYRQRFESSSI